MAPGLVLAAALLAVPARAASPLARAASVALSGESFAVGAGGPEAVKRLDCAPSTVQRTILRCKVPAAAASFAACLGWRIDSAALNVHYQGRVLNMSVEFADSGADALLSQLRGVIGSAPKVQYWADDAHLYASYIWVDGEAEIEVTKTLKGPVGDGKTRLYVSSLSGDLPLNPDDAP